jgi:hypothetical protein
MPRLESTTLVMSFKMRLSYDIINNDNDNDCMKFGYVTMLKVWYQAA